MEASFVKKLYSFLLLILIASPGFSQSLGFSTLRQIFNYEVGDSFEYESSYHGHYDIQGSTGPFTCGGRSLMIITSVSLSGNILSYGYVSVAQDTSGGSLCSGGGSGVSPFPRWQNPTAVYDSGYVFKVFTPDSSFPSMYYYAACSFSSNCYDTAFRDGNYNNHRQNHRYDDGGLSALDETCADSVGPTNGYLYDESTDQSWSFQIIWYHKANGERWGQPQKITWSGLDNVNSESLAAKLFPNPSSGNFNLQLSATLYGKVYFELFDISGRRVYHQQISETLTGINLSGFNAGLYLWKLQDATKGISQGKLVLE